MIEIKENSKRTNADRIRNMTDTELAHFCELMRFDENNEIPFCKNLKECDDLLDSDSDIPEYMCEKCMLDWLKSEVQESDTDD